MAGVKITDLEVLNEAASDDLLYIVDVSDNTQSPQGTSKQIEVSKVVRNYKVYSALLNQSGETAPIANVLENTLGFTPTWERSSEGRYELNNPEFYIPCINRKVITFISPVIYQYSSNYIRISANIIEPYIQIITGNYTQSTSTFLALDNLLRDEDNIQHTSIEIRIYN